MSKKDKEESGRLDDAGMCVEYRVPSEVKKDPPGLFKGEAKGLGIKREQQNGGAGKGPTGSYFQKETDSQTTEKLKMRDGIIRIRFVGENGPIIF